MKTGQSTYPSSRFNLGLQTPLTGEEKRELQVHPRTNNEMPNYFLNLPLITCDLKVASEKESRWDTAYLASEAAFHFSRILSVGGTLTRS